jgi:AcrR family transcriptional regulator
MQKIATPTLYRQELKERILKVAMQEFKLKGIKSFKMDDIASLLSISKRTLYEIYANKEDLLLEGIQKDQDDLLLYIHDFAAKPENNVMDVMIEFFRIKMESLTLVTPQFFTELHKYQSIVNFLAKRHADDDLKAEMFFKKGIEEGFFRKDFDYKIVMRISNAAMAHVMETQMYKEYDLQYVFRNVIFLFVRGFCTIKGLNKVDKLLEEY